MRAIASPSCSMDNAQVPRKWGMQQARPGRIMTKKSGKRNELTAEPDFSHRTKYCIAFRERLRSLLRLGQDLQKPPVQIGEGKIASN